MGRPADDFAAVLRGAHGVESDMARDVLREADIPCLVHGPDFDVAELGTAVHHMVRGRDVYVPRELLERARAALQAAWGPLDKDGHPLERPAEPD